jgi:hypothetical protein
VCGLRWNRTGKTEMKFWRANPWASSQKSCARKTRILGSRSFLPALFLGALALPLLLPAAGKPQGRLERLETEYNRETGPVKKAKKLVKLGRAELAAVRDAINAGNIHEAASLAERYRDQVTATHAALVATGVNPEKKPDGFKQLQVSLRENLFRLRDLSAALPLEQRAPFVAVEQDLAAINQQLLLALFPRSPNERGKHRR